MISNFVVDENYDESNIFGTIRILTEYKWKGIEENPPSLNPEKKGTRGASPKTKARNLLDRFIEYKEPILRFLTDLKVPF